MNFAFHEGLPDKYGSFLFVLHDDTVATAHFNPDNLNSFDPRVTSVGHDGELEFISTDFISGFLTP
jgi:hypothetical protein